MPKETKQSKTKEVLKFTGLVFGASLLGAVVGLGIRYVIESK